MDRFSLPTAAGLIFTPLLIAAGQILFKLTSARTGDFSGNGLFRMLIDPYMVAALGLYGCGTIVWIYVLKTVPLTIAYSFMALTFCFVPLLAAAFLHEGLTGRYFVGALFIVAGMIVVNV